MTAKNRDVAQDTLALTADVRRLLALIRGGVLQRISEAQEGPQAARVGSRRSGTGPHADPTALRASRASDMAGQHHRDVAKAVRRAHGAVIDALRLAALYPEPRPADAADRAALARLNGHAEPGCQSCARIVGPAGVARWEPIDTRLQEATTVGDRLDEPWLLCVWCHDKARLWGRLPTPAELAMHHRGARVPWPADVERPA